MATHVICTAGHVDHGKSALVRALTGVEPDRLVEERRRGLTIDLGFAAYDSGAERIAFVDLPGHQRFVRTMLAGAGPVRTCLFVVAADEGWMPQSQEHLEILDLLGVAAGVVAVTKTDLVDAETAELAVELTREAFTGTGLAGAPVVPVSARTGAGLDRLADALAGLVAGQPPAPDRGRPRLWVDRAFSIRGAGTVVTGTLTGGRLAVGDEVELAPGHRRVRVRGLHEQDEPVTTAGPGERVAVNLVGAAVDGIRRGDALVGAAGWSDVAAFEAEVRALPNRTVVRRGAWELSVGAGEWPVRLWPVDGSDVPGGGIGMVRVELPRPAPLAPGDRFVLREAGRAATMGGGVILDVAPAPRAQGRRGRVQRVAALRARAEALADDDIAVLAALVVRDRGWVAAARLPGQLGRAVPETVPGLVRVGDGWADQEALAGWERAALGALAAYHERYPLRRAAPVSVAIDATGVDWGAVVLDRLVAAGGVVAADGGMRVAGHQVRLSDQDSRAAADLLGRLGEAPFAPPGLAQVQADAGASDDLVRELAAGGSLVLLGAGMAVTAQALADAHERLLTAYESDGPLTASRVREVLGTSRKYALPLLAELDRTGRTARQPDDRRTVRPLPTREKGGAQPSR